MRSFFLCDFSQKKKSIKQQKSFCRELKGTFFIVRQDEKELLMLNRVKEASVSFNLFMDIKTGDTILSVSLSLFFVCDAFDAPKQQKDCLCASSLEKLFSFFFIPPRSSSSNDHFHAFNFTFNLLWREMPFDALLLLKKDNKKLFPIMIKSFCRFLRICLFCFSVQLWWSSTGSDA